MDGGRNTNFYREGLMAGDIFEMTVRPHRPQCVTLITGWDDNRLIGNGSGLPWHIPQDLKLFKERTKGQIIIMGLKTYNGLPKRPLPDRTTIVIMQPEELKGFEMPATSNTQIIVSFGVKEAIIRARQLARILSSEIFICGGASIYRQALEQDLVDRMLISVISGRYEGNVYFPEFPYMWDRRVIEEYDDFVVEEWTKEEK